MGMEEIGERRERRTTVRQARPASIGKTREEEHRHAERAEQQCLADIG